MRSQLGQLSYSKEDWQVSSDRHVLSTTTRPSHTQQLRYLGLLNIEDQDQARLVCDKSLRQLDFSPTALLKKLDWQQLEVRRSQQRLIIIILL